MAVLLIYYDGFYDIYRLCRFPTKPTFNFENNTALLAGEALYGGWIDSLTYPLNVLSHLVNDKENPSLVASNPT